MKEISEKFDDFDKILLSKKEQFTSNTDQLAWIEKVQQFWDLNRKFMPIFYKTAVQYLAKKEIRMFLPYKLNGTTVQIPLQNLYDAAFERANVFTENMADAGDQMHQVLFGETQQATAALLTNLKIDLHTEITFRVNKLVDNLMDKFNSYLPKFYKQIEEFQQLGQTFAMEVQKIKDEVEIVKNMTEPTSEAFDAGNKRIEEIVMLELNSQADIFVAFMKPFMADIFQITDNTQMKFFEEFKSLLMCNSVYEDEKNEKNGDGNEDKKDEEKIDEK